MKTSTLKIVFRLLLVSIIFIGESFANDRATYDSSYSASEKSSYFNSPDDNRRKIRLGFTAPSTMHRQLLLTEDENATSGIDWGYDGEYYETEYDDMYWLIEGQLFTIQGTNVVDETSNFPLGFHTNDDGMNSIGIDALENISGDFNLYIFDKELEVYHNLRDSDYEFYADAGEYFDRFELVFRVPVESSPDLPKDESEITDFNIYYNSASNILTLNSPSNTILKELFIYSISGQLIYSQSLDETTSKQEIRFNNQPAKGTYIVLIETDQGTVSEKTILY
ncbi:T9SS type A sorting domain-containing protein [Winogradskyella sp. MIT101101]|uniref:T9SS type A sorting domain-containing protein n=1 Tax=Winogradskyella sp. MIT101101 TaxID=3098297 RepID=UPI00399BF82A